MDYEIICEVCGIPTLDKDECHECPQCNNIYDTFEEYFKLMSIEEDTMESTKNIEVTYKFYLPDHEDDITIHQNASKYFNALHDIYNECREIYKYSDSATEEFSEFCEKIAGRCCDAGIWDVE